MRNLENEGGYGKKEPTGSSVSGRLLDSYRMSAPNKCL